MRRSTPGRWGALGWLALPFLGACASTLTTAQRVEPYARAGSFQVETLEDVVLAAAARDRELHLRLQVPAGSGPFPVIVFSHGTGGSKDHYLPLTELWASHGYVTVQPTHVDARNLPPPPDGRPPLRDWEVRQADLAFLLASLAVLEEREPALAGKLDRGRIGVGGHSAGAASALILAGAAVLLHGEQRSLGDPAVRAFVALAPGPPGKVLTHDSWATLRGPLLVMAGSRDVPVQGGATAQSRLEAYELAPHGDKYRLWVDGMGHTFGGIAGAAFMRGKVANDDHVRLTRIATLAFWDAYLKGSRKARRFLRSGALTAASGGTLRLDWK